jgi:hypothetical protein
VFGSVVASRPEEQMRAAAAVIARQRPDVVGLQEVALWQTAPYVTVGLLPCSRSRSPLIGSVPAETRT